MARKELLLAYPPSRDVDTPNGPVRWSEVFRRSASGRGRPEGNLRHLFAVRASYQETVVDHLDQLAQRGGGGSPGCGSSEYSWTTQWGRAELCHGWGSGMWVDDLELLLVLCDRLGISRPPSRRTEVGSPTT